MGVKKAKPTTSGRRFADYLDSRNLDKVKPLKGKTTPLKKKGGRNSSGQITVRHRGGGHKRLLRKVDYRRRNQADIKARVAAIEYDPNRNAHLARLVYANGVKNYILAPQGLKKGDWVVAGEDVEVKIGNALPLEKIPVGTQVHNVEISPGKGGQIARGAGTYVTVLGSENKWAVLKMPSGERRKIPLKSYATVGQVSNPEAKSMKLGKAGRKRNMGWRPAVRGVVMHPGAHPHGGGEGRSGIGMPSPKSPWGKKTLGKKTRKKKKYSNKLIIKRRK